MAGAGGAAAKATGWDPGGAAPNGTQGWPGKAPKVCCGSPGTIGTPRCMGMSDRGRYADGGGGNTGRGAAGPGAGSGGTTGGVPSIDVRENWATSWFMMDA